MHCNEMISSIAALITFHSRCLLQNLPNLVHNLIKHQNNQTVFYNLFSTADWNISCEVLVYSSFKKKCNHEYLTMNKKVQNPVAT